MRIILITGQTATGKTKLAIDYAKKYNGELINCDSRQIYKYLDIITGKDIKKISNLKSQILNLKNKNSKIKFNKLKTLNNFDIGYYEIAKLPNCFIVKKNKNNNVAMKQCNNVKLWLYDIVDPKQYFSSYNYQQCALFVIKKILAEGKTPIIVGGTYLYLKHLLYEFDYDIPPNFSLREKLNNKSVDYLQKYLFSINPQIYNSLNNSDRHNPQRLIRKIEIATSLSINQLINTSSNKKIVLAEKLGIKKLSLEFIGLKFKEKEELRKKIKNRVEERLKKGAIEEVEKLIKMGYQEDNPGLKTIGYQQIIQYLKGKLTKEEAINQWITKEIQYAKRQYTFMKKDENIEWREVTS